MQVLNLELLDKDSRIISIALQDRPNGDAEIVKTRTGPTGAGGGAQSSPCNEVLVVIPKNRRDIVAAWLKGGLCEG